jgi:uncharacterized protein (TIGR01319 family)
MKDNIILLIDIGSTFTKVVAVDLDSEEIISRIASPSTVKEDVTIGIRKALKNVEEETGNLKGKEIIACSSAAGGLQVVSIGLVPELSSEAAKRAALGAGAKIVGHYSHKLTLGEVRQIEDISPDLVLLAGGTDGGNEDTILHNASMLSCSKIAVPIIVAGNKSSYDKIERIFNTSAKVIKFVKNVMPEIGKLEVEDCREGIREVFMQNIIKAKGIDKAKQLVKDIIMPTPVAVLNAAVLISKGVEEEKGWGDLIVIDVGGATTDVYSIASGHPGKGGVLVKGLPEPYAKRTVEGDLGVRHNIDVLYQMVKGKGVSIDEEIVASFRLEPSRIPRNQRESAVDEELARIAVEAAFERHAGKIEVIYSPMGELMFQVGKDLTGVDKVIGTGGPIAYSTCPKKILRGVLDHASDSYLLKPRRADFYIDGKYIMYAMGLLAQSEPKKALRILKKYLEPI